MPEIIKILKNYYRNLDNKDFRNLLKEAGIKYLEFGQEISVRFEDG